MLFKIKSISVLAVLLCFCTCTQADAQNQYEQSASFDTRDGLSHNHIYQTFQDKRGFIWLVTGNGLQFYDGHVFKKIIDWPVIMSPRETSILFEDNSGRLWINTAGTFRVVNTSTLIHRNASEVVQAPPGDRIADIMAAGDNTVYLATENGLLVEFDPEKGSQRELFRSKKGAFSFFRGSGQAQALWLRFNATAGGLAEICSVEKSGSILFSDKISDVAVGKVISGGRLAVMSHINFTLTDRTGEKKSWNLYKQGVPAEVHLWEFDEDVVKRTIYACNDDKLYVFNPENGEEITGLRVEGLRSVASIYHLMTDRVGNIWLSTINGLIKLSETGRRFQRLFWENPALKNDPFVNSCRGFAEDAAGNIYLSVSGNLYKKTKAGNSFRSITSFDGAIYAVSPAENACLWITRGDLAILNTATDEKRILPMPPEVRLDNIWSLYDDGHIVWLGHGSELLYFDKKLGKILTYNEYNEFDVLKGAIVYEIVRLPSSENRWLITSKGIFELNPSKGIMARYAAESTGKYNIPFNNVRHIFFDDGRIWMATAAGLVAWNRGDGKWKTYTQKDGLPNDNLYAVYGDQYGFLWMSSDQGIIQFHKESGKFRHFTEADGISNNEFNRISHLMASDGSIYFGSVNGVTAFHPADFRADFFNDKALSPELVEARLFSAADNRETDQLPEFLSAGQLTMYPGDRYLKIRFGNPNLINSGSGGEYLFRIEGIHSDWQPINFPEITLSGMPYGLYYLEVRTKPVTGKLSDAVLRIPIEIVAPFYMKWWFWVVVLLTALAGVRAWTNYRSASLIRRQKELETAINDATQRINADNELIRQQAGRIARLSEEKTRFYINLTHEFRTPLSLIIGPLKAVVRNRLMKRQEQHEYISTAIRNAEQLIKLANDMLFLEKEDVAPQPVRLATVNLISTVQDIIGAYQYAAMLRHIRITLISGNTDGLAWVTDMDKLTMILGNLLQNAIKFSPEYSKVVITLEHTPDGLVIQVKDQGRGISPVDMPHIFERFYQTQLPNTPMEGGTGIGLAIVRELVELLKGDISVESRPGQGASFSVSLPVLAPTAVDAESALAAGAHPVPFYSDSAAEKPVLLLVEDNTDFQEFLKGTLNQYFTVHTACNGETAMSFLMENRLPDLIVCDAMMPYMDGFQLIDYLKAVDAYAAIPVLMLTARAGQTDRNRALSYGVTHYLVKPFDEPELIRIVLRLTEKNTERPGFLDTGNFAALIQHLSDEEIQWMRQFESVLMSQLGNPDFSVPALAASMGIGKNTLYRKLYDIAGMKPNDFIQEARLQKARHLLERMRYSRLNEVMEAVGLKDARHFSQLYYNRFGKFPESYYAVPDNFR